MNYYDISYSPFVYQYPTNSFFAVLRCLLKQINDSTMFKSVVTLLALLGSASAFLPASAPMRVSTAMSSKFDNKVWGIEQKKEIYE